MANNLEQVARETVNAIIRSSTVVALPSNILNAAMQLDIAINSNGANKPLTQPREVNPMDLTPEAVQLAHAYMSIVEQQERGDFDNGLTPKELDLKRTRYHNKFLEALKRCRVDTRHRGDTTELARRIVQWMPD